MIKNINRLLPFMLLAAVVSLYGCKKETPLTVSAPHSHISLVDNSAKTFYVFQTAPGDVYKIPVGITNPLDRPVTINFTYTSATAVAGTHYSAPASITIPPGKVVDTIQLQGMFANIPAGVTHTVVAKISGGDLPALGGADSLAITLRRYCSVDVNALAGSYTAVNTSVYDGVLPAIVANVSNVVSTSATTATATITNIHGDYPALTANVIFDWTDAANFKVILDPANQTQPYTYQGAPTFLAQTAGTSNSFSSCDNTITLNVRFYTSAGTFDQWRANMTHQ